MKLGQFCVDDPSAPRLLRECERGRETARVRTDTHSSAHRHTDTPTLTHTHSFVLQLIHFFAWHSIRFHHSVHFVYYEAAPAPSDLRPAQLTLSPPVSVSCTLILFLSRELYVWPSQHNNSSNKTKKLKKRRQHSSKVAHLIGKSWRRQRSQRSQQSLNAAR